MKLARILILLFTLSFCLPAQAPVDINTADAATLKTIPGIGDAYAAKIIANRPYKGKDEIVSKAGVPKATYDKVKDKIVAKQMAASDANATKAMKETKDTKATKAPKK